MDYTKPLPKPDVWSKPFWEGAREGELRMQHCAACEHTFFPPGPVCPKCLGEGLEWRRLSGRAEVVSWVVFHQLYFKGFAEDLPYNVSLVRLDEGPLLYTNVVGIDNADLKTGLRVEAVFEKATDAFTIPRFRAVAA